MKKKIGTVLFEHANDVADWIERHDKYGVIAVTVNPSGVWYLFYEYEVLYSTDLEPTSKN